MKDMAFKEIYNKTTTSLHLTWYIMAFKTTVMKLLEIKYMWCKSRKNEYLNISPSTGEVQKDKFKNMGGGGEWFNVLRQVDIWTTGNRIEEFILKSGSDHGVWCAYAKIASVWIPPCGKWSQRVGCKTFDRNSSTEIGNESSGNRSQHTDLQLKFFGTRILYTRAGHFESYFCIIREYSEGGPQPRGGSLCDFGGLRACRDPWFWGIESKQEWILSAAEGLQDFSTWRRWR